MEKYRRLEDESETEYKMRIGLCCKRHELTWEQATPYLNEEFDVDYGESAWRKGFTEFFKGYLYACGLTDENVATRILSISDLHVPFQKPIETFAPYAQQVDILQLNGDILDCYSLSRWPKAYHINPIDEIIEARDYLIDLIRFIKPAKVVVNIGNHDYRLQTYLNKSLDTEILELMPKAATELIFVDGFTHYDKANGCKKHYGPLCDIFPNIIEYHDDWYSQIGQTIFCHPLTYSSGIMQTAEKARRHFKDEGFQFDCLVMAHTHKTGHYDIGNTVIYEQGACCDTLKQNYNAGKLTPSQREGFMILCQDKDGKLIEDKTRIIRLN